ncbi:MAG: polysaccharide biosynthesis/export family protein [Cyclobacteriaceae bacterium]
MFNLEEGAQVSDISSAANQVLYDYVIQSNDYLTIEVYSNNGERVIDPNPELSNNQRLDNTEDTKPRYLVNIEGRVKLPMVGEVSVEGLALREAEARIEEAYKQYFKAPYVNIAYANKRVILLGATEGKVIPMENQNLRLTEVLALGGGLNNTARANNIRILRGNEVFISDLSTLQGYRTGDILIKPGDIVYVEPVRRPGTEALKDYAGILSLMVSLASLIVVIVSLN